MTKEWNDIIDKDKEEDELNSILAPVVTNHQIATTEEIIQRVAIIQDVMKRVMQEGEHFGVIPGTGSRKTLFKSGAEKLSQVFKLLPRFDIKKVQSENDHRDYEVRCILEHADGSFQGEGVGNCSTKESKYRWRKGERTCPECSAPAIIKGKKEYGGGWLCFGKKGGCGAKWPDGAEVIESQNENRIENEDVADTYNTVLKMAKKRAHIDAIITATAASDIFTQDVGDVQEDNPPPFERAKPVKPKSPEFHKAIMKEAQVVFKEEPLHDPDPKWAKDLSQKKLDFMQFCEGQKQRLGDTKYYEILELYSIMKSIHVHPEDIDRMRAVMAKLKKEGTGA